MSKLVVNGAKLKCSQGMAPSTLTVLPANGSDADEQPAATVMDFVPMLNVAPFGMCQTEANPQVAAATAAAMGALTPMPCVPVLTAPWSPGASILTIQGLTALSDEHAIASQRNAEVFGVVRAPSRVYYGLGAVGLTGRTSISEPKARFG